MVDDLITFIENTAAGNYCAPERIVEIVRRDASPETDFGQLHAALEARIAELVLVAKERPDHPKLSRGIGTMQKVAQLLAPGATEVELTDLANKIRVCVGKADNYAATAGQHLRAARERCREVGLDFNKWCTEAELGIKRRRIYQLMGPDPIAAERRATNHNVEPENEQSLHIEQLTNVTQPDPLPPAPAPAESATETLFRQLQDLFRQLPPAAQFDFVDWAAAVPTDEVPPVRELAA